MGSNEQQAPLVEIVQHVGHAFVVAGVRLLDCIPDWRWHTKCCSERPFLAHVSSSNQFDTQIVTERLRTGDFILYNLAHSLEVALVAIQDGVVVPAVELMR